MVRRFRSFLTDYASSKKKTLKYEFALAAWGVWAAVTVRIFLSGDPAWIAAQAGNYGTLTSTVYLYITAAVITQAVQNKVGDTTDLGPTPPISTAPAPEEGGPLTQP